MKKTSRVFAVVIICAAVLAGAYFWMAQQPPAPAPQAEPAPPASSAPPEISPQSTPVPPIQHPLEPIAIKEALPTVQDSDARVSQALSALIGKDAWQTLFFPEQIIRHIVATVDNLPRSEAPSKMWPVRPAGAWMQTMSKDGEVRLAPANATRYAAYMALVQALDIDRLAGVYRELYPVFQQAYVDLGYPDAYFNDRLVAAIDDLLAAPELAEPPVLLQKKVRYQFADPELERRSAGQKIMLRIGADNARIVKEKLRKLRAVVTQPVAKK
jgi:hypothetical protein